MPLMQFVNGLLQTLSANAQTAADTAFTPTTVAGFPLAPQFTLLNIRTGELVLVTALAAQWTIVRGYGGSAASAFNAGDALQYSVTREMLIGGMMVKLDDQVLAADVANGIVQVVVPAWAVGLCRNLQLRIQGTSTPGGYLMWRFNNDATATYSQSYAYWGSGSSSGQWNNMSYGRCWSGYSNPLPLIGHDVRIDIGGADTNDRYKTWLVHQWLSQSNDASTYIMVLSGRWAPTVQAAISNIQISTDNNSNGTWASGTLRAGWRAMLYGVP